jgi:hypothetical protein
MQICFIASASLRNSYPASDRTLQVHVRDKSGSKLQGIRASCEVERRAPGVGTVTRRSQGILAGWCGQLAELQSVGPFSRTLTGELPARVQRNSLQSLFSLTRRRR